MDTKEYKKLITEGVEAVIRESAAKDLLDSIAETMEEKLEIPKAQAKAQIKAAYDLQYKTEQFFTKKERIETLYDNLELL